MRPQVKIKKLKNEDNRFVQENRTPYILIVNNGKKSKFYWGPEVQELTSKELSEVKKIGVKDTRLSEKMKSKMLENLNSVVKKNTKKITP